MLVLEAYILIGYRNVDSAPYSTSLTTYIIGKALVRSRQAIIDQAVSKKNSKCYNRRLSDVNDLVSGIKVDWVIINQKCTMISQLLKVSPS